MKGAIFLAIISVAISIPAICGNACYGYNCKSPHYCTVDSAGNPKCHCWYNYNGTHCENKCPQGYGGPKCGCEVYFGKADCGVSDEVVHLNPMRRDFSKQFCYCNAQCIGQGTCCFDSLCSWD